MKKKFLIIAMSAFLSAQVNAAGLPVIDLSNLAQAIVSIGKLRQQITNQIDQIKHLKNQFKAVSGSRNLGEILNNPLLKAYLPEDWKEVYEAMNSNGKSGMSSAALALAEAAALFESCENISASYQKRACENQMGHVAQNKSNLLKALDATSERLKQIDKLMSKINDTKDQKAIAELQARINAENAHIQNMATQLAIYDRIAAAEEKIAEQRARQAISERIREDAMKSYY